MLDPFSRQVNFNDPKQYVESPAKPLLCGNLFQKNAVLADNMQMVKDALVVLTEVQMCATATKADVSERCKLWGPTCQNASGSQANPIAK